MLHDYVATQILEAFPHQPTQQQNELVTLLAEFITSPIHMKAFMLKGYAGTGKTTIVSSLVHALSKFQLKTFLLAPTGRAAKVLSSYSGKSAYTIHKKIYRQKSITDFRFQLSDNLHKNTLFIVDEASMISNSSYEKTFGSGRLLEDLIQYVYSGEGCSMLLLGDSAQLPPVEQDISPALEIEYLKSNGLEVTAYELTQVVRQSAESGILNQATMLRDAINDNKTHVHPKFSVNTFTDITPLNGMDLIDAIDDAYNGVGMEDTIVVTRSNKRANLYNNGIRSQVMMREEELANGDLLMVTRNNYFWNKNYEEIDFIANGDVLEVVRIGKHYNIYGNKFVDLSLRSLDYNWEIDARVWLNSLQSENPSQMNQMTNQLFQTIAEDYPEIANKRALARKVLESEFFNALQVKFAYAVTCHKAQGGQWKKVFIDHGYIPDDQLNIDYYRWLYTAITRATEQVFLVNFPKEWFEA